MRIIENNVETRFIVSKKPVETKNLLSLRVASAFTLVELIMVMAIISIVSVFSFSYFWDFSSKQAINEDLSNINTSIKKFDIDVRNMKIYDYKMIFSSWSFYYTTYTNYQNQDYRQIFDFDKNTYSGTLSATWNFVYTWANFNYSIYSDTKKILTNNMPITSKYTFLLSDEKNWQINSSISGAIVNDIYLNFYSQENTSIDSNLSSKLILDKIYKGSDKTWELSQLIIENINNKKFIKDQNGQIIDKAFLFFERAWKEISLEIK